MSQNDAVRITEYLFNLHTLNIKIHKFKQILSSNLEMTETL